MVGRFTCTVLLACLAIAACRADSEAGAIRQLLDASADAGATGAQSNTNTFAIEAVDPFTGSSIVGGFAAARGQDPAASTADTLVDLAANTGTNSAIARLGSGASGKDATSISAGVAATNPLFGAAGGLTSAKGTGPSSQAVGNSFLSATSLPSTSASTTNTATAAGTGATVSLGGIASAGQAGAAIDFTNRASASKASSIINGVAASGLPVGGVSRATGYGNAIVYPGFAFGDVDVDAIGNPTFTFADIKTSTGR